MQLNYIIIIQFVIRFTNDHHKKKIIKSLSKPIHPSLGLSSLDNTIANHCLVASNAKSNELGWLWHRRLGHASIDLIDKLIKNNLVDEIP